jgi:hypothetical protein
LTLEFSALLREAQLYEARLLAGSAISLTPGDSGVEQAEHAALAPPASQANVLWVDPREAARRLGLSVSYLAQLRIKGGGPAFGKYGRAVRYRIQDLDDWSASRMQSSISDVHHVS